MSAVHVFCYHGLGDAMRYALPLALAFAEAGAQAYLHTRHALLESIGKQPRLAGIVSVPDKILLRFANMDTAAAAYLTEMPPIGMAVFLGSSELDVALERACRLADIPCWGRLGPCTCLEAIDAEADDFWHNHTEYHNTFRRLCQVFNLPPIARKQICLNPDPAYRQHPYQGSAARPLVGVHGKAQWPARSYPHYREVIRLLSTDYVVWNFDDQPCDNLARLCWIMHDSLAVLTVDTLILHLANRIGTLALNIQGPVWKNRQDAAFFIPESRLGQGPTPLAELDRNTCELDRLEPAFIANAFHSFLQASDRTPWAWRP